MTGNTSLDMRDRAALARVLDHETFDLLIIGGGITGAGIARDAAMRGLNVVLIEASDFASGTSSRSSKLVHGGLRYLAQGELALVTEAATERSILRNIAPHLAQPMPFVIPATSKFALAKWRTALWTYEKLGRVPPDERHLVWNKTELQDNEPCLDVAALSGAVVYAECLTEDTRLTLANLRSAAAAGATITNYTSVIEIMFHGGRATAVKVRDHFTDVETIVNAQVIVNATGPWVDAVRKLEDPQTSVRLQLTAGIHLVVPHAKLPVQRTILMVAADKRLIFAIPKDGITYIGTTDTFYADTDYWPRIAAADVEYLLAAANKAIRTGRVEPADITAAWAGIRPLVSQPGKSPSEISRRDEVWEGAGGILSIAGGKLTAYRRMAARVVDNVQSRMGHRPTVCRTDQATLVGGARPLDQLRAELQQLGVQAKAIDRMVRLYGDEAPAVAAQGDGIAAEVHHAVIHEGAVCLEDYWVRRSLRAWFSPSDSDADLERAASAMAELMDWDAGEKAAEIQQCRDLHHAAMAWRDKTTA
ncbi:MAG: glycerol-3-phosphate dehydrogenase/oxidase [Proteobacteria bacterium]|nr:MAG: glycerol-3-phosphate dehydrogenase/oxidase [Pseudomonadota bacterium]